MKPLARPGSADSAAVATSQCRDHQPLAFAKGRRVPRRGQAVPTRGRPARRRSRRQSSPLAGRPTPAQRGGGRLHQHRAGISPAAAGSQRGQGDQIMPPDTTTVSQVKRGISAVRSKVRPRSAGRSVLALAGLAEGSSSGAVGHPGEVSSRAIQFCTRSSSAVERCRVVRHPPRPAGADHTAQVTPAQRQVDLAAQQLAYRSRTTRPTPARRRRARCARRAACTPWAPGPPSPDHCRRGAGADGGACTRCHCADSTGRISTICATAQVADARSGRWVGAVGGA